MENKKSDSAKNEPSDKERAVIWIIITTTWLWYFGMYFGKWRLFRAFAGREITKDEETYVTILTVAAMFVVWMCIILYRESNKNPAIRETFMLLCWKIARYFGIYFGKWRLFRVFAGREITKDEETHVTILTVAAMCIEGMCFILYRESNKKPAIQERETFMSLCWKIVNPLYFGSPLTEHKDFFLVRVVFWTFVLFNGALIYRLGCAAFDGLTILMTCPLRDMNPCLKKINELINK